LIGNDIPEGTEGVAVSLPPRVRPALSEYLLDL
jgi:hypothetical protein